MEPSYILAEIRRTTEENGGIPLGRSRFFKETGIRERDWNRFWPRWSEAVRAAGVQTTNTFTTAIPDEVMLGRLAALTRELGKFPVIGELRVKARADDEFPSPETYRRLGGMRALAERLRAYALESGDEELAALCPKPLHRSEEPAPSSEKVKPVQLGSVYLMKSGRFFKIGHTNAVGRRERELSIQLPDKLKVIHEIRTDDPAGIEHYWHRRFAERRRNGEWFDLVAEDVAAFRRRKTM